MMKLQTARQKWKSVSKIVCSLLIETLSKFENGTHLMKFFLTTISFILFMLILPFFWIIFICKYSYFVFVYYSNYYFLSSFIPVLSNYEVVYQISRRERREIFWYLKSNHHCPRISNINRDFYFIRKIRYSKHVWLFRGILVYSFSKWINRNWF